MSKSSKTSAGVNSRAQTSKSDDDKKFDLRKQLFNDRKIGPIEQIQLPAEMITRLWGILLDIDPHQFRDSIASPALKADPSAFYEQVVRPWLSRHPVLSDAEVLLSGRGLHVIPWFGEPVEITSDAERQRWSGVVRAVQAVLPTDPDAPGITATTRARGSVNSKCGVRVRQLHPGKPIAQEAVLELFEQLRTRPFRTLTGILFGSDRLRPCPVCQQTDTGLNALDRIGQCYGSCGKVSLGQLYDVFLAPRAATKEG
jgi:hypothetical protein